MPGGFASHLNTALGQAKLAVRVRSMLGLAEDPNVKVGINGFGRMGRLIAHAIRETEGVDVVAINDPYIDAEYMAYMLDHDATHGKYRGTVLADGGELLLDGRPVVITAHKEPSDVNWVSAGARYVIEASGCFDTPKKAGAHLRGGAQRVVVCAPCGDLPQFVAGINHLRYNNEPLISAGSAATHSLALLCRAVDEACGIVQASASVLHASRPQELEHVLPVGPGNEKSSDWRSGRGNGDDVIPCFSAAATAVGTLLPALKGRVHSTGWRVPAPGGVSCVDLTVELERGVPLAELKRQLREAARSSALAGRLGYRDDAVGGGDFADDGRSCIIDGASCLAVNESFVKLVGWYQNEWPYAKRVVELLLHLQAVDHGVHFEA
jgi:glyceraldehyde 3-phosphate dehydrogenase